MGTEKRDRQKANRHARLEAERAAEAKARRNRSIRNFVVLAVVVVLVLVVISLTGCSSDSDGAKVDTKGDQAAQDGEAGSASAPDGAGAGADGYGTGECPPEGGVDEPVLDFDDAFGRCIDEGTTYTATIETTEGTVVAELDPSAGAPITVNNFVSLARSGFFDDNAMFRTEAQTGIIQTGSPHTQDNTDPGPGYSIPDEGLPWTSADYGPGTLAMANSGPDTGGGQFFFLASEGGSYLGDPAAIGESAGAYTVFGKVTEGLDVLQAIAALDTGASTPSKDARILTVTIGEA